MNIEEVEAELAENADAGYRDFSGKLTPTQYPMTGVRIPILRKLAARIVNSGFGETYLQEGKRDTHEQIMLAGFVTAALGGTPDEYLRRLDAFMPYIDNWAVCDCVLSSCKAVKKFLPTAAEHFFAYAARGVWERRVLAVFMMDYLLTDEYIDKVLDLYATMPQGEYYVDMAIAWGLSVALVKYYEKTADKLRAGAYSTFVTNKAIQKARESYRISPEHKTELLQKKKKA